MIYLFNQTFGQTICETNIFNSFIFKTHKWLSFRLILRLYESLLNTNYNIFALSGQHIVEVMTKKLDAMYEKSNEFYWH